MYLDLLIFLDNIHGGSTGCKLPHWMLKNRLRKKKIDLQIYFKYHKNLPRARAIWQECQDCAYFGVMLRLESLRKNKLFSLDNVYVHQLFKEIKSMNEAEEFGVGIYVD